MGWTKTRIELPITLPKEIREELAQAIVSHIQTRTRDEQVGCNLQTRRNYSLGNRPYTEKYADKKGVSEGDVDLTLSSEMLDKIEVLNIRPDSITVGFSDTSIHGKVEGNQKGTYGQSAPIKGKARPFLQISKGDLNRLIDEITS
jgi:hypothetical protein